MSRRVGIAVVAALVCSAGILVAWRVLADDGESGPALEGVIELAVLAPSERVGETGRRGGDLIDGARMAATEINALSGLLGRRLVLTVVDDACSTPIAYEAAKAVSQDGGFAGVIGGVCEDSTAREVSVIDASGVPFLVTSASRDDLFASPLQSTYLMNGTTYQQGLSAVYWMNYRSAQRLALVRDGSKDSQALAKHVIRLIDETPQLVSLQTVPAGERDLTAVARAAVASGPDFVLWTGGPAAGGALAKALRESGYKGTFTATAASESPEFLAAAGPGGAEGAFITATSSPQNTPTAAAWRARFVTIYDREPGLDALQAYDAVRALAQAIRQAGGTDGVEVAANLAELDLSLTTALGVVRFAIDHTLLYDNRVILVVKNDAFVWKRSLRTDSLQGR